MGALRRTGGSKPLARERPRAAPAPASRSGSVSKITDHLLDWYRRSHRDLPWRRTTDPYRIWVSEAMLQQTQVATVIPYYERFVERFPDVASLARAPLDDVIKAWEGLGYYARARNLHAAARDVMNAHGGRVPADPAAFRSLPGVGEYMTAAVQSIAFGAPLAVVDGNVKRVVARLLALRASVDRPAGARAVQSRAQSMLDARDPAAFNQAMMELGATVCRPRRPLCGDCPVSRWCRARAAETPEAFPMRERRREVPVQRIAVGVVSDGERVLITRRANAGMLGGLWEFPGGKVASAERARAACAREIREETGLRVEVGARIARVRHAYSHLVVDIDVFHCRYRGGDVVLEGPTDYRWITLDEAGDYAFPKANHKFLPAVRDAVRRRRGRPARKTGGPVRRRPGHRST